MECSFTELIWLIVSGSIAFNLLMDLLFYEFRIHFANNYVVKISYKADETVNKTVTYAIKAFSVNGAYIYAIKKFAKLRSVDGINSTNVREID